MMPIEVAIDIAFKRANQLGRKIEAIERNTRCMDGFSRSELGMLRRFLFDAGVSHDQLPEVPFVDPEHLKKFQENRDEARERRRASAVVKL